MLHNIVLFDLVLNMGPIYSYIYMIKQDIRIYIYVANSRPNAWNERAEIFCGHSWAAGGVIGGKEIQIYFYS